MDTFGRIGDLGTDENRFEFWDPVKKIGDDILFASGNFGPGFFRGVTSVSLREIPQAE